MINKATLIGNLGRDPELRRFDNGGVIARFSIATNENYRDKNGEWQTLTEWHEIVCRGAMAERVEKELRKGRLVYIEGRITHRKYTDQNNVERQVTEIAANVLRILDRTAERPMSGEGGESRMESSIEASGSNSGSYQDKDDDGDLPF